MYTTNATSEILFKTISNERVCVSDTCSYLREVKLPNNSMQYRVHIATTFFEVTKEMFDSILISKGFKNLLNEEEK